MVNWNELSILTSNEAVEAVANILNESGANGVVIEDPTDLAKETRENYGELYELDPNKYPKNGIRIKAYFADNETWKDKRIKIEQEINKLENIGVDLGLNEITVHIIQEADWENEWKQYFKPIKVTSRFTIVPLWEKYVKESSHELVITIDPGMAFGTGKHPTTILSLQGLEKTVRTDDIVLDVGAGSGILSVASVLLGAKHVYGYDLDEVAVQSSSLNRDINQLTDKITVSQNNLLKGINQKANVIVSNILADILLNLVDDAWENLVDGGYFITSGIIKTKQKMVKEKLEKKGFQILATNQLENWLSFIAQK